VTWYFAENENGTNEKYVRPSHVFILPKMKMALMS